MLYMAIQNSVYRHDIIGVFSTLELAEQAAEESIREESDHFHSVVIVEADLDARIPNDSERVVRTVWAECGPKQYSPRRSNVLRIVKQ